MYRHSFIFSAPPVERSFSNAELSVVRPSVKIEVGGGGGGGWGGGGGGQSQKRFSNFFFCHGASLG